MTQTSQDHPFRFRIRSPLALLISFAVPIILTTLKHHVSGFPASVTLIGFVGPVLLGRKAARILKSSTQYDDSQAKHMASAFVLCLLAWVGSVIALSIVSWSSPFSMKMAAISTILYADGAYSQMTIPNWRDFLRVLSTANPSQILSAAINGVLLTVVLVQGLLFYLLMFYSRISSLYANL